MLRILLIFLLFFAAIFSLFSEPVPAPDNAKINGYVYDESNNETLVGATVFLINTKKGTYTNRSGFFSIADIEPGTYRVRVSMIGYETVEREIKLNKTQILRDDFRLKPVSLKTDEISITAEREVETRQITISRVNVPVSQIKEIRIGGESDVFRSLQYLPGVLTSSQLSSGLFIRGGSPDQNLVLIDGSTVYNPSHLFGFISTFNSDAIKDVELIKGGYPAEYGSRLSSVINITQKDGNRNKFEGLGSLGMLSSKLSLEGPLGNGSWFIAGRRTYLELIKMLIDTDPTNPIPDFNFYDVNAKITQDFSDNDRVFLSGFISNDDFDYNSSGFSVKLYMGNKAGSLRWSHIFGGNLFTMVNLTGSKYTNGFRQDLSGFLMRVENNITDYSLKATSEWYVDNDLTVNLGTEITNYIFEYFSNFSGETGDVEEGYNEGSRTNLKYHDWVYSAFTQVNYRLFYLLSLQAGLRLNYWDYSNQLLLDPRLAIRYQFDEDFAVKASFGYFHQYLRLAGDENFSLFDTWLPTDKTVNPSSAVHYILSFETKPFDEINVNLDIYYKDMRNISIINPTALEVVDIKDIFYEGDAKAYGMEIFAQRRIGKLAGWFGYALGWVTAKFDEVNNGEEFRPKFDRRHDLKLVLQYELDEKWQFGATFMFQSGQSYTGATSRFQSGMPGDNYGWGKVIPSKRYGLRLPPSHQLNLSASYKTTIFGLPSRLILDIFNVYNRRDILMRYYNTQSEKSIVEDVRLLPIIPTFSIEVKF